MIDTYDVKQGQQTPPLEMVESQVKRSTREHCSSTRNLTSKYTMITEEGEPESFQEVQSYKDKPS